MFKANEVKLPLPIVSVFAVNNVEAPNDFCVHIGLEEQMMDDDFDKNIEDFLELNDLLPKEEVYPFGVLSNSCEEFDMGMGLDDLGDELENLLESSQPEVGYIEIGFINFHAYIDSDSPVNVISRARYNEVMSNELVYKENNFVGVAKNVHIFVGCYTYLADFVVLEDVALAKKDEKESS
ncbi:hypothetical protein Tco_1179835, partial [Tanacetum coccineum]